MPIKNKKNVKFDFPEKKNKNNKKNNLSNSEDELSDIKLIDNFNSGSDDEKLIIKPLEKSKSILNPKSINNKNKINNENNENNKINNEINENINDQIGLTEKMNENIKKKGRGRPKKEIIEEKKESLQLVKIKEEKNLTEDEKLLKLQLIEKYKKYRSTFEFKRKETVPERLTLAELQ